MDPPQGRTLAVQIGGLSDAMILDLSSTAITEGVTFNSEHNPIKGGVVDAHLGTIAYTYQCSTCNHNPTLCPGHSGHVELNVPTVSPIAAKIVATYLRIICHRCGKRINNSVTFAKASSTKRICVHCGYDQPKIRTPSPPIYVVLIGDSAKTADRNTKTEIDNGVKWFPHEYRHVLERITPETLRELGIPIGAHPKNFINNLFPIASIVTHPDTKQPGASTRTSHDPITSMYTTIVSMNKKLKTPSLSTVMTSREHMAIHANRSEAEEEARNAEETEWIQMLTMVYNCIKDTPEASAELGFGVVGANGQQNIMQSLLTRLKGKQGYIRGHQLGKPTSYMARATIVCNPTLEIDTILIPQMFARKMQVREVVQRYNYDKMLYFFQNGLRGVYPGCRVVVKHHDPTVKVRVKEGTNIANVVLEIGDVIYRDIITGDVCLFNRMPTLFYASMNKQRIIVSDDPNNMVIGMSELATPSYNADFDGDEMTIILIQTEAGRAQIMELSSVTCWFHGYKDGTPHFKPIQSTIVLPALATRHGTTFSLLQVMRMFGNTTIRPRFDESYDSNAPISGRDIISLVLPKVNYRAKSAFYEPQFEPYIEYHDDEKQIVVNQGKITSGVCDQAFAGVYSIIMSEYGARAALTTMFNVQQLSVHFTHYIGASVCIQDLIIPRETEEAIAREVAAVMRNCELLDDQQMRNEIIPPVGLTVGQFIERQNLGYLKSDFLHFLMKDLPKHRNGVLNMILYGATGKYVNLKQVRANVGQKQVNNERLRQRLSYKRTLPYFPRFSTTPQSRGFICNSLIQGSTPSGIYIDSETSRQDLLHKTAMTANTGYQSRISGKNLEGNIISNNGFCEKENGKSIVQQAFGDNGFDPRYVERVKFPTIMIDDDDFAKLYNHDPVEFAALKADRAIYREQFMKLEKYMPKMPLSDTIKLPLNIKRVIDDILTILGVDVTGGDAAENADGTPLNSHALPEHFNQFRWDNANAESETPELELAALRQQVRDFIDDLPYVFYNPAMAIRRGYIGSYRKSSVFLVAMSVRSYLHTGVLRKFQSVGNARRILAIVLKKAWLTLQEHTLDYGAPIGMLSALCISEPVTQLSLNAIHVKDSPGAKTKDDFVQLKEIMGVKPLHKCIDPVMRMHLFPGTSEERAREIANMLEMMQFNKFVTNWQVFFEDFGEPAHSKYAHEKAIIDEFMKYATIPKPNDLLRYCLRFELDSYLMILKNISIQNIISGLMEVNDLYFVYSSENVADRKVFLRIYMRSTVAVNTLDEIKKLVDQLLDMTVRGVRGIISATSNESMKLSRIDEDGRIVEDKITIIKTYGVNLHGVFMLQRRIPEIDYRTVVTDNVSATGSFFGIGAARMKVIGELNAILSGIAYCHFTLAADEIVTKGYVTPITPAGPKKRSGNPLLQLADAKPTQVLEQMVKKNEYAEISGISASLVLGQMPRIGSNFNSFLYNTDFKPQVDNSAADILDMF